MSPVQGASYAALPGENGWRTARFCQDNAAVMMKSRVLSEVQGLGRICRCAGCPDLHLSIGPMDIRSDQEALDGLAVLVNQAAQELRIERAGKILSSQAKVSWPAQRWSLS